MSYVCRTCGAYHDERPTAFMFELPAAVAALPDTELATRVARSSDQCILDGKQFFILGNVNVPIRGGDACLTWTVWSTLSEKNFRRVSELWKSHGREAEPPYFGWLSNQIPGYPSSINIKALVHTQPVGIRPKIEVIEEGHTLTRDQREGVTEEQADALIHAALHQSAA